MYIYVNILADDCQVNIVDQASFEIMVNISKHDNHVSQQMPADMSTA